MSTSPILRLIASRIAARAQSDAELVLTDAQLCDAFGVARITRSARRRIASALQDEGLEVSGRDAGPLVLRRVSETETEQASQPRGTRPKRRLRTWASALAVLGLVIVLADGGPNGSSETAPSAATTTVYTQARHMADHGAYDRALRTASSLGAEQHARMRVYISRRVADRAMRALNRGDRELASVCVKQAFEFADTRAARNAQAVLRSTQSADVGA